MGNKNLLMANIKPGLRPGERELTSAEKLVKKTWSVIVSRSQVMSPEYAEMLGVPANSRGIENVAQHGAINTALSAAKLADIFAIGGTPFFRNPADTVELYADICNYLFDFKQRFETNHFALEVTDNLMGNVLKLENFAEWVFGIAIQYMPREDIISKNSLAGRVGGGRFTRDMFTRKSRNDPGTVAPEARSVPAAVHGRITDETLEKAFETKVKQKRQAERGRGWV